MNLYEVEDLIKSFKGHSNGRTGVAKELLLRSSAKVGDHVFRKVDSYSGDEDGERNTWIVFTIDDYPELWRVTGYYDSYDGAEWEYGTIEEVERREILTTVFVSI